MWEQMGFVFGGGRKMLNPYSEKWGRLVAYALPVQVLAVRNRGWAHRVGIRQGHRMVN